ncbi:MAG TPA: hypothetical protein VN719_09605 [Gemmatimonadales bacterium]|nr:hypothetical protein [Gemmatimonadales bacterium]
MPAFNPPVYQPGDPITARDANAQNREIRRLGGIRAGAGLAARQGPGGLEITRKSSEERIFIVLTGTYATGYPWKEVLHIPPNTWIDSGFTGSTTIDPAFERQTNDTTLTVDGTRYEARRCPTSGVLVFDGKN